MTLAKDRYPRLTVLLYFEGEPIWTMFLRYVLFRFVAIFRPLNAVLLYSTHGFNAKTVLCSVIGDSIWVVFWLFVFERLTTFIF